MDPAALQQPELFEVWGRDPERTPMQWDASPNAGFTAPEATPWLPLAADYRARNVAAQADDPASMLNFFRALTELRRAEPALNRGDYHDVDFGIDDVLAYWRTTPGSDWYLVVLNLGGASHLIDLARLGIAEAQMMLSTDPARVTPGIATAFSLAANEGVILRLPGSSDTDTQDGYP